MSQDDSARLAQLLDAIPYLRFLGMQAELGEGQVTGILPFKQPLVGNASIRAIHGGVLGALMEMTALLQLGMNEAARRQPRTIDVTVEYLRSARSQTTYARADVRKVGRRIANVHVEAWQDDRAAPVAALRGHFMLSEPEAD